MNRTSEQDWKQIVNIFLILGEISEEGLLNSSGENTDLLTDEERYGDEGDSDNEGDEGDFDEFGDFY